MLKIPPTAPAGACGNANATGRVCLRRALPGVMALALIALSAASVRAGSCLDQVNEMAAAHALTVDPPNVTPREPGEGPRDLGKSGGVIEPPKVDDPAVIKPPPGVQYGMPTMPDVKPNAPPSTPPNGTSETLNAQDTAILESILVAARDEAQRGEEAGCFRKLQTAQDFLKDRK